MSTASEREAALRRALLRAAEQIEPAPGGLERIQVRLRRPRPALLAWIEAAWTALVMRAPDVIEAVRRRSVNVARLVWERFGPKSAPGPGPHRLSWVRPLVAMSVAVFVLGGGVYVALQSVSSTISPTNGVAPGAPAGGASHTGSRGPSGSHGTTDGQASRSSRPSAPSSPRPSTSCTPRTAAPFKTSTVSPDSPIDSSTPAPTTSSPTTTTTSPSPSPSDTGSPAPSDSTTPSSGGSASTPDAGTATENPASAGGSAVNGTATETAVLVSCQT
jgi:hypothetical protein